MSFCLLYGFFSTSMWLNMYVVRGGLKKAGLYSRMFLGTADLRIFNPKIYRPAGGSASPKPHCFSSGWLAASPET